MAVWFNTLKIKWGEFDTFREYYHCISIIHREINVKLFSGPEEKEDSNLCWQNMQMTYSDREIWAWQGKAVDSNSCRHSLDRQAKSRKEIFPEHEVNKVDYRQQEHQVRNGCCQLSCHCDVFQHTADLCSIWNRYTDKVKFHHHLDCVGCVS